MSGITDFVQINPASTNQEPDATYFTDPLVTGGAATNALLPSLTFNKIVYQFSTWIAAHALSMANKNYSTSDGSPSAAPTTPTPSAAVTALAGVLNNILTFFDLPTIFTSPNFTGTPTTSTPAQTDNSSQIVNSSWAKNGLLFSLGGKAGSFFIAFPKWLTGGTNRLVLKWGVSQSNTTLTYNSTVPFTSTPALVLGNIGGSQDILTESATGATLGGNGVCNYIAIGIG